MKTYIPFLLLIFILGCKKHDEYLSKRIYFNIDPLDRKIVISVQLNDSINANLFFDTGASLGTFSLDSTFCSKHSSLINKSNPFTSVGGSAWTNSGLNALFYKDTTSVDIGSTELNFNNLHVFDIKGHWCTSSDGIFNIPNDDTTHIWELNFDNNYLEIHSSSDFVMPENCVIVPIVKGKNHSYPFNIQLPLEIVLFDGDTLNLSQTYLFDSGMPDDIALMHNAKEIAFFHDKRDDAIWTKYSDSYSRRYNANAILFDKYEIDSLRIYTYHVSNRIPCDYILGLNFLKRFNVFIDLGNNQIGLQRIINFKRVVNPNQRRFHISWKLTSDRKFKVKEVGDYKSNPFKSAGLQKDDELITINGMTPEQINSDSTKSQPKPDSLIYVILRNGEKLNLVIHKDPNEKQGD